MHTPRRSVLVAVAVSLALLPATSAAAKPVSTYSVETGPSVQAGENTFSLSVSVSDTGTAQVEFFRSSFELLPCGTATGYRLVTWTYTGPAAIDGAFDSRLDGVSLSTVIEAETRTDSCGSVVTGTELVDLSVDGTAVTRAERSRDSATGTRYITRDASLTVTVAEVTATTSGQFQKSISRA